MQRVSLTTVTLLLAGIGCSQWAGTSAVGIAEERAVLVAALDSLYGHGTTERLVVSEKPVPAPDMVEGYARRSATPCDLYALLTNVRLAKPLEILPDDPIPAGTRPDEYWKAFYARYPKSGGRIDVSCPAFDSSGTLARVQIGRGCGGRCGALGFALLEKRAGRWIIVRHVINRMS
jgi:hypothetical protein